MATKINIDGYNSYSGADIVVTAQLSQINGSDNLSKKCYILGSLQTISISTFQDKSPVRAIGNINAKDYVMGPRSIAGSLVFAVFDRHFAYDIFNDLKEITGNNVFLTDEIPALDMTICFSNEYGKKSKMVLYGIKMVSEGQVMSINDLFTENTYQFVGTGLENLTPEDSVYPSFTSYSKDQDIYIDPTFPPFKLIDIIGDIFKFDYSGDTYNQDYFSKSDNFSFVKTNQPLTNDDYGTIIVELNNPNAVELKLINKYLTDDTPIEYCFNSSHFGDNNIWNLNLPQGNYNLVCIDKETQEELEVIENINIFYSDDIIDLNDYPLIDAVSNNSIKASINNPEHNILVLTLDNMIVRSQETDSTGQYTFENLIPNTKYIIYSTNDNDEQSKKSSCTTLSDSDKLKNDFRSFVLDNKKLWINDLSEFDYNILFNNNDTDYNLINKIIKNASEDIKYELLIYAIKYQNSLLKIINSDNNINEISNNNLILPSFDIKNNYNYLNFYYTSNDKEYYAVSKNSYDTDFIFNDFYDKHLSVYAVDSDNLKSLKYEFFTFNDLENKLENYKYKSINYDDYNYNYYKNKNTNMDEKLLETIILKDNNTPILSLLKAPYVSYDTIKQTLYVYLDYEGLLDKDKRYYLCISSKDDIFQHLPINKVLLDNNVFEFTLDKYQSYILKDNYYFIYIENEDYEIISNTSIINTYSDNTDIDDYNYSNIKHDLATVKNILLDKYSCSDLIESSFLSSISSEDILTKNIYNLFRQELLNEGINSIQYNNLDSVFLDSIISNYDSYIYSATINYNKDTKELTFYDNNLIYVMLDFYKDEDYPTKKIIEDNNIVLNNDSYYTVVYGIKKTTKQKTGFFLKNNSLNKTYMYKLSAKQ